MLPNLKTEGDKLEANALRATGTDRASVTEPDSAPDSALPGAGDVSSSYEPRSDVIDRSAVPTLTNEKTLISQGLDASRVSLSLTVVNTGDGTRTHDLRIMRPPL